MMTIGEANLGSSKSLEEREKELVRIIQLIYSHAKI